MPRVYAARPYDKPKCALGGRRRNTFTAPWVLRASRFAASAGVKRVSSALLAAATTTGRPSALQRPSHGILSADHQEADQCRLPDWRRQAQGPGQADR